LPSRDLTAVLLRKEWHELRAARAWWLYLLACGLLVGHAYGTAVASYAEVSGGLGGPAALAQGVSPLDGFVVPVLGAYAVAATLLLPFVAIRLLSAEKEGGGLALLMQGGVQPIRAIAVKFAMAMTGWLVGLVPGVVALLLWRAQGGHLDGSEVGVVLLGHLLRASVTIALALAAAAFAESASTAAIVALGVTLATWALDFVAAVQGGLAQRVAALTPESMLRVFERGELSASIVMSEMVVTVALLVTAAQGLRSARLPGRSMLFALVAVGGAMMALRGAAALRWSADLSEDRRNSFPASDERALASLAIPIDVEAHLAPEDPRLVDLERGVLAKLRRAVPRLTVRSVSPGTSGLFAADTAYGQVVYTVGDRRAALRSTTPEIVLETIYQLAGTLPPAPSTTANADAYPGYPIVVRDRFAPWFFYLLWPVALVIGWLGSRRAPVRPSLVAPTPP
jgi:ABC-2 type transport system permease protein